MFSESGRLRARVTPAVLCAVALFSAAGAHAQQTTVVGRQQGGSVTVDTSVLDELGRAPNVPQLLQPSVRSLLMPNAQMPRRRASRELAVPSSEETIHLKAPSGSKRSTSAKRPTAPKRPTATRPPSRPTTAAPMAVARPAAPAMPPPPPTIAERPGDGASGTMTAAPPAPPAPPAAPMDAAPAAVAAVPPPPPPPPAAPPAAAAPETPAAAPPPPAAPTARPAAAPRQTASLPPSGGLKVGQQIRLGFAANAVTLDGDAETQLDGIAKGLTANTDLRLQLLAYAGGADSASQARRLSLSRALAVRSYLIRKGVRSTNIDVRALGDKFEGGPPDRVDAIVTAR